MRTEVIKCDLCGADAPEACSGKNGIYKIALSPTYRYITYRSTPESPTPEKSFMVAVQVFKDEMEGGLNLDLCDDCWNDRVPRLLSELFKRLMFR